MGSDQVLLNDLGFTSCFCNDVRPCTLGLMLITSIHTQHLASSTMDILKLQDELLGMSERRIKVCIQPVSRWGSGWLCCLSRLTLAPNSSVIHVN
ncbi:hypothetical protein VN97_g9082 [Penicillium thymicola]|uniref:Uncharacterized protein n=1 Tax=Penicillium thymicola TaxID=293382 RepID=A0AAI9TC45_PENTH|nr:hypothetical protein VN97_g9082 [Penicillium thymicola]